MMKNEIKNNKIFSLWLIGPSAAGKTTISKKIYEKLSIKYKSLILLDGDQVRNIFANESGYDPVSRSKNIRKYVSIVNWLSSFKASTIVAAINAFEKDRYFSRQEIQNYKEVYLKCDLQERIKRDKKKLYLPAINGEKKNVVDVDIPFEDPINCDLRIQSDLKSPDEIAENIIQGLKYKNEKK